MAKGGLGLGSGLSSLFEQNAADPAGGVQTVRITEIEQNRAQPRKRFDDESLTEAVERIRSTGVKQFFLSQGDAGILAANGTIIQRVGACASRPVNMTGAGDACLAALAVAYLQNKDLTEAAQYANAAASIAIESMETINEKMSLAEIEARVAQYNNS